VKFRASRRLRFEDTKRIMSPEMGPKSFGTFEKQAPGLFGSTTILQIIEFLVWNEPTLKVVYLKTAD